MAGVARFKLRKSASTTPFLRKISSLAYTRQPAMNNAGFRNGPVGVKSLVSASRKFGALRERASKLRRSERSANIGSVVFVAGSCFRPWSIR